MARHAADKNPAPPLMPITLFFPAQIFSKLLFASKNTLSRVMVLVVSMGYGITK